MLRNKQVNEKSIYLHAYLCQVEQIALGLAGVELFAAQEIIHGVVRTHSWNLAEQQAYGILLCPAELLHLDVLQNIKMHA